MVLYIIAKLVTYLFKRLDSSSPAKAPPPSGPRTTEEILVLFGSQTGNSEAAAREIAARIPSRLTPAEIVGRGGPPLAVTARALTLDDFLELERAAWTRVVVIVCSSYGVGQAPLGCRYFREVCDSISEHGDNSTVRSKRLLFGVKFALLGLGDSHYTTYFRNPTAIEDALTAIGATRVGPLGKADASGTGEQEQSRVVERWTEGIWDELAKAVAQDPAEGSAGKMERAQKVTYQLCLELFPEWRPNTNWAKIGAVALPLVGAALALVAHFLRK